MPGATAPSPSPSSPASHLDQLLRRVDAGAPDDGARWLRTTAAGIADGGVDIRVAFAGVSRRVGRGGLGLDPHGADAPPSELQVEIGGRLHTLPLAAWRIDDAARAALVCAAAVRDPDQAPAVAVELYQRGDPRERTAVLRALSLIAGTGRAADGLAAVLDAVRTNQGEIFEAAVCDNPYSGALLPDLEFGKAVLKAVFVGLSIRRIAELERRAGPALTASLLDLVTEREAASRPVAAELWAVMALHPPPGLAAKLLGYLEHPAADHRAAAATALGRLAGAGDPRLRAFLHDRAGREPVAAVRDAIGRALA